MKTSKKATGVVQYGSDLPALRRNLERAGFAPMSPFEEQVAQEHIRAQYPRYRGARNNALLPWQFAMIEILKMRNHDFTMGCPEHSRAWMKEQYRVAVAPWLDPDEERQHRQEMREGGGCH